VSFHLQNITVSSGFSFFSLLGKLRDYTVTQDLTPSTAKYFFDCVLHRLSHFIYLPAVKNPGFNVEFKKT